MSKDEWDLGKEVRMQHDFMLSRFSQAESTVSGDLVGTGFGDANGYYSAALNYSVAVFRLVEQIKVTSPMVITPAETVGFPEEAEKIGNVCREKLKERLGKIGIEYSV
jgi:hypothetical protein